MHTSSRMPVSDKQLAANRANAQKSTGPKSPRRVKSLPNPIACKRLGRVLLLPGESQDRFAKLVRSLEAEFLPETPNEQLLVSDMAVARWRILRGWAFDAAGVSYEYSRQDPSARDQHPIIRTVLALRAVADNSRHPALLCSGEAQYQRAYYRALSRLERLREKKNQLAEQNVSPADLTHSDETNEPMPCE